MFTDRTFWGVNLSVFVMMIGVGMIVAILPQKLIGLTGNTASVGYLASAFALSYVAFQVPIGRCADRIGFAGFLVFGYLVCAGCGLIFFFANGPGSLFWGRFFQGIGEAPVWALAPALLSLTYPKSRGVTIGCYQAAIHLGLTVGPLLGIAALYFTDENNLFLIYSILCLVGAALIAVSLNRGEKGPRPDSSLDLKQLMAVVAGRKNMPEFIVITLYGVGYGIFLTTIPAFLLHEKGFTPTAVGLFFSLFYLGISAAQLVAGFLVDAFGEGPFMVLGLVVAAIGLLLSPGMDGGLLMVTLGTASFGLGILYLASMSRIQATAPDDLKGTLSGAFYFYWGVGMFAGPVAVDRLIATGSPRLGFGAFASLLLICAVGLAVRYARPVKGSPKEAV